MHVVPKRTDKSMYTVKGALSPPPHSKSQDAMLPYQRQRLHSAEDAKPGR